MADDDELEVSALVSTSATNDIAPMAHVNEHPKTLPSPGSTLQNKESEFNSSVSYFAPCFWLLLMIRRFSILTSVPL